MANFSETTIKYPIENYNYVIELNNVILINEELYFLGSIPTDKLPRMAKIGGVLSADDFNKFASLIHEKDATAKLLNYNNNPGHHIQDHLYAFLFALNNCSVKNVIIPEKSYNGMQDSSFAFGTIDAITRNFNRLKIENDKVYFFDKLIITGRDRYTERNENIYSEFRRYFQEAAFLPAERKLNEKLKILVHNNIDAGVGRSILNIENLLNAIKNEGWDYIFINGKNDFSEMTVAEQFKLYHGSDLYISPWGGSIPGCIVCPPNYKMIILRQKMVDNIDRLDSWWFHHGVFERYHQDLGFDIKVADCEFEVWDKSRGIFEGIYSVYDTPYKSANLYVDVEKIINLIKSFYRETEVG